MNQEKHSRSIFDWIVWTVIHGALVGGIGYAGFKVYGETLGAWVTASAVVAGFTSMFLFAKEVPGETLMKVWLGLCVACNAAYLVHNGALAIGAEAFNRSQVEKFKAGMESAKQTKRNGVAHEITATAKAASELQKIFTDDVSRNAAALAFLELASAIVLFSIASKRAHDLERAQGREAREEWPREIDANGNDRPKEQPQK